MQPHYIEFITVGFGIFLLMFEAFSSGNKSKLGLIAAAGLTLILILQCFVCTCASVPDWMSRFYHYDQVALFYKIIALVSTILVLLMAVDFRKVLSRFTSGDTSSSGLGEFFCLPVFACAGLMWMASARDLVSIFVALELVTITFYVMVAYMRKNVGSLEAGVKYLILGALSTGFLVYGIAWIYGALGTTEVTLFSNIIAKGEFNQSYLLMGIALILIALGFKVGAAPMQLWIPDVYQGAPTPITAYLSVASKAAGFLVMMVVLGPFLAMSATNSEVVLALSVMAGATLLYGNLAALQQENFKRLLAYSSIAHAGFLLMGVASRDFSAVSFYLGTYLLMTFAAFFVLALVRNQDDSDLIDAFDGLGKRNPLLAAVLTITMAALAGIPLTAGFWGKFFIFAAAINAGQSWWLLAIAFVSVAAGFYYYLKVVKAMYWNAPTTEKAIEVPVITKSVLALLTLAILLFGIWPQPIMDLLK
ncbi:NADH-quinone oxidoreductase subunit N [Verrucomicrobiaceae bacterium 5K15]|uniref:NADH-quinone oxidoreductase subunit N n=1 Tax=Oceaniferula flava TaxID=2800421 RepID=A0AAE2SAK0_9BACT|nr:NADH-quinone oxidoreductase subunit N [Oceaniferula flavus]MBK1854540.1 NADH-quinone oxidoreductase subunit N [Oceaniferula flavus]MBM1135846.1 NADH-quinone oxidoreductase subunit N [Oceaniferula flavus]